MIRRALKRLVALLPSTTITVGGVPYLTRYYVFLKDRGWGNVYIHHFHSSDQGTELHNHPWKWGLSLVLEDGYFEDRSSDSEFWERDIDPEPLIKQPVTVERREVRPGTINFIRPKDFHRVDLRSPSGAWSVFIAGPRIDTWGFLNRETGEYKDWRKNPEAIP